MEEDGFRLPSKKRGGARVSRGNGRSQEPSSRADGTVEDIVRALAKTRKQVEGSDIQHWLIRRLNDILGDRKLYRILLIGNGHFDASWEPGAHQLALVQLLREEYGCGVLFQEPCISTAEAEWVSAQDHFTLRTEMNLNVEHADRGVELVVFVHGLHFLTNDLLWTNWNPRALKDTVFLCNDYCKIDLIGGTIAINKEFEALNCYRESCKCIELPVYQPHPTFFRDTAILHWDPQGEVPEIGREKPMYSSTAG